MIASLALILVGVHTIVAVTATIAANVVVNTITPRRYGLDFLFWCFLAYVFKYEFAVMLFSFTLLIHYCQ